MVKKRGRGRLKRQKLIEEESEDKKWGPVAPDGVGSSCHQDLKELSLFI